MSVYRPAITRLQATCGTAALVIVLVAGCSSGDVPTGHQGPDRAETLLAAFCGGGPRADDGPIAGIRVAGTDEPYSQELTVEPETIYEVCVVPPVPLGTGPSTGLAETTLQSPGRVTEHPTEVEAQVVSPYGPTHVLPLVLRTAQGAPSARMHFRSVFTLDTRRRAVDTEPDRIVEKDGRSGVALPCTPLLSHDVLKPCGSAALFRLNFFPDALTATLRGVVTSETEPFALGKSFHSRAVVARSDLGPDGSAQVHAAYTVHNNLYADVRDPKWQLSLRGPGLTFRPDELSQQRGPTIHGFGIPAGVETTLTGGGIEASGRREYAASIHLDSTAVDAMCRNEPVGADLRLEAPGHPTVNRHLPFVAGPDLCRDE